MRADNREEIHDLQEIHDDITDYLYDTDYLQEKAREKLQELRRAVEPPRPNPRPNPLPRTSTSTSGRDSGYQSPRISSPARCHRYLTNIETDAERIKAESMAISLRMENEVERLKAKSIAMAKDLIALNKVIERQKRELVDLTRMKRSNERVERDLEYY